MDPQHGATDFEPGRVSQLYDKLAGQVDQLPPERRQQLLRRLQEQELAGLVKAQEPLLAALEREHAEKLNHEKPR